MANDPYLNRRGFVRLCASAVAGVGASPALPTRPSGTARHYARARVLGGPAKQPLAAILLDTDLRGEIVAVGTCGGEMFERVFREFRPRLALESRTSRIDAPVSGDIAVVRFSEYCRNPILC